MVETLTEDRILKGLYRAVDRFNAQHDGEVKLEKDPGTQLYGKLGRLDSLGLVNFVVTAEAEIELEFGRPMALADERALSQERSPFRSIGTLADYIAGIL